MNEKEAILARHSVRNYRPDSIEPEKVLQLRQKMDELNRKGNLHLQLMEDAGNTYNRLLNRAMGLGSAPSVIACVGKDTADLDRRIGYYGQQLVLFAQSIGLNTCWAGTFNRRNIGADVSPDERLVISIAIGYGKDQGKPHRSKEVSQIIDTSKAYPDWFMEGVDMALLAPTAINQQKFRIELGEDDSVEFIDKGGPYSQVDIGIIQCNFEIGAGKLRIFE